MKRLEKRDDKTKLEILREIMEKYDVKHPLRGEEYKEYRVKQPFKDKIRQEITNLQCFLNYKNDARGVLERSVARSDDVVMA